MRQTGSWPISTRRKRRTSTRRSASSGPRTRQPPRKATATNSSRSRTSSLPPTSAAGTRSTRRCSGPMGSSRKPLPPHTGNWQTRLPSSRYLRGRLLGTLLAYVLVRFRFPGRGVLSGISDLPFAIPTLVTGVMLVALYGPNSPVGGFLDHHGVKVVFATPGIVLALLFVTLPLVVRTVEPVLLELDPAEEEAARVLGATSLTTFRRIVLPAIRPAIAAGALLTFARALGEFGAIVIVSGNLTGRTLTAPVFIFQLVSQFHPEQAAAELEDEDGRGQGP